MKKFVCLCVVALCCFQLFTLHVYAEGDDSQESDQEPLDVIYVEEPVEATERQIIEPPFADVVDNRFYVQFIDEQGNVIQTGQFTDNKTCSNYDSESVYFDGTTMHYTALACAMSTELNVYEMTYRYPIQYVVSVQELQMNDNLQTWIKDTMRYDSIADGVTFSEINTPFGCLPLEGSVTIAGNKDCTDIHIVNDETGRAYIKDDVLYIVYRIDAPDETIENESITDIETHSTDSIAQPVDVEEKDVKITSTEEQVVVTLMTTQSKVENSIEKIKLYHRYAQRFRHQLELKRACSRIHRIYNILFCIY